MKQEIETNERMINVEMKMKEEESICVSMQGLNRQVDEGGEFPGSCERCA